MKFMLDTNIFDLIIDSDMVTNKVCGLVQQGLMKIVTTHIQEDELGKIPDVAKRKKVALVPREIIDTSGFVWGASRYDMARFGGEGIDEIRQGNPRHTEDALIAATAEGQADVLVTEDATLGRRVRSQGFKVEVWSYQRFSQHIESL